MAPIDSRAPFRFVVAVTDPDWFVFLSSNTQLDEVNFWRPGATTTAYERGTPWFYLLRGSDKIVGGAFFSAYDKMPASLAWDTFGVANGTVPWKETRRHDVRNGLLLRSDIHNLFDAGYVTVDEELRFVVSQAIREEFENGRDYYALHGRDIRVPIPAEKRPLAENLEWHRNNRFKG